MDPNKSQWIQIDPNGAMESSLWGIYFCPNDQADLDDQDTQDDEDDLNGS